MVRSRILRFAWLGAAVGTVAVMSVQVFGGGTSAHEQRYESMTSAVKATLDAAKVPDGQRGTHTVLGAKKLEAHCGAFQSTTLDPKTVFKTVQEMAAYLKGEGWRDNVRSEPMNVRLIRGEWRFSIHATTPPAARGPVPSPPQQTEVQLYLQSDAKECV